MRSRYLAPVIDELCFTDGKIALVAGPRQCGKTTLAKMLLAKRGAGAYFNWDQVEFRRAWAKNPQVIVDVPRPRERVPLVVLDEIHKARLWKRTLKGVYDTLSKRTDLLVTGSARLAVRRKGSDSLLGRYRSFRLHPFSFRELGRRAVPLPDDAVAALFGRRSRSTSAAARRLADLMAYGPFPEPFLAQDERRARLWRRARLEALVREDLRDITRIADLDRIEMLAALLPERVGSTISVASLREYLDVTHDTTSRWLRLLSEVYYSFELKPYAKNIARSLKKEGKFYAWDYREVDDEAARFENLIAAHLLKSCHYWTDSGEGDFELRYVRTKDRREIDFLITRDGKPWLPVEAKLSDQCPSSSFGPLLRGLGCGRALQLVRESGHHAEHPVGATRVLVVSADEALDCFV